MGSVTAFGHKYRTDPFFRTEIRVIGLQVIALALLLLVIGVTAAIFLREAPAAFSDFIRAASAIVGILAVSGYIITRTALTPVRNTLDLQKQFIGNVAHDLRTPLAVIKAETEVALMSLKVSPELQATLASTIEELDRTSETISRLLTKVELK